MGDKVMMFIKPDMSIEEIDSVLYIEEDLSKYNKKSLVKLSDGSYNFLDRENRKLICKENLERAYSRYIVEGEFVEIVRKNGGRNALKSNGEFLSPNEDFCGINYRNELESFLVVRKNGKCNFLKLDGTFLSSEDFKEVRGTFKINGQYMAIIERENGEYNFLGSDGCFLGSEDFLEVKVFGYGDYSGIIQVVRKNGLCNYLNGNGELVSPNEDFLEGELQFHYLKSLEKRPYDLDEEVARVRRVKSGEWNYLKLDGTFKYEEDTELIIGL